MYDFEIRYKKGIKNGNADALSRIPIEEDISEIDHTTLEQEEPIIINIIIAHLEPDQNALNEKQQTDQNLQWMYNLKIQAQNDNKNIIVCTQFENSEKRSLYAQWRRIHIFNNTLYRTWSIKHQDKNTVIFQYIVPQSERLSILKSAHDNTSSGHLGIEKTAYRIQERFYWPRWELDITEYILSCTTCQRIKSPSQNLNALLHPILSKRPMEIVLTDCIGKLPRSKSGNEYAIVIIDHFTKWVDVFACRDIKAPTVAKALIKWITRNGIPDQIISDQGTNYMSELIEHIFDVFDIHKTRTAAYHPQADGLSERFVRTIKQMISAFVDQDQKDWDQNLDLFCFAYNTATQSTTKHSPYYLLFGRQPKIPIDLFCDEILIDLGLDEDDYANQLQRKLKLTYEIVTSNRDFRMQKAKIRHDRTVRACKFKVNDQVWLQVKKVKQGTQKKLAWKWQGPYIVLQVYGETTYRIKPVDKRGKTITAHRDRLKKNYLRPNKFIESTISPIKIEDTQSLTNTNSAQQTNINPSNDEQNSKQPKSNTQPLNQLSQSNMNTKRRSTRLINQSVQYFKPTRTRSKTKINNNTNSN